MSGETGAGGDMFARILTAVDGSDTARAALAAAVRLAKDQQAQLRIVHVVDEVSLVWPEVVDFREFQDGIRQSGRKLLDEAQTAARAGGVAAETKLLEIETLGHRIADLVVAEADSWPADVIVVGTHGRRGLSRLMLGSVAELIARVASKPVLLIRSPK
jgi:nucleotide-binding universal stress UspA family protein